MIASLVTSLKESATQNHLFKAFYTFSLIIQQKPHHVHFLLQSLASLIESCSQIKAIPQGKQLHAFIVSFGFQKSPFLVPKLVTFYSASNLLNDAYLVTETSNIIHPLPWNLLVSGYVKSGLAKEEFDLGFGREVHGSIVNSGLEWNLFVDNALVSMYAKCGALDVARKVFDEMRVRDGVSWNSIISGYVSNGMWSEAFGVFDRMRNENVEVDVVIWNMVASGYLKTGDYKRVLKLISQLRASGDQCDPVAVITDLNRARLMFQLVENKSVITWNSMISGFAIWDDCENAAFLFREMFVSRVEPNYVTIASVLPLCARVANLNHGKEFHAYIIKHEEFKDYLLLWNSVIDMYARSGKISIARKLFDFLTEKNEVTYTSIIAGYGIQGDGKTAIELFENMIRSNVKPDHVTMVAVLSACSHSALVDQGQTLFERMSSVYNLIPKLEHFSCMVDLYGRSGLLRKAEETIRRMPYHPTPAMWATVVGGCRIYGNKEIGSQQPRDCWNCGRGMQVIMCWWQICMLILGVGKRLAEVRVLMRELGVNKVPGCAWVDVGGGFIQFLVADTNNNKVFELYELLDGLNEQLKEVGYIMCDDKDEAMEA
ncbi:hypothetical protein OSB04_005115 [Centaurea solstitialis]|uniref:Pentatricopeptide repeat-containing protein n=1 Tax=Centaurea solstitialis TaxID=347529 RepID=A0AA38WPE1_9ASTR|nr:hypothetical protein OSB04_005115 [Centaurea solstitialis]